MADIYDIDFSIQTANIITPTKRKAKILDYMNCIADALQYVRDNLLDDYKDGSMYPLYNALTAYSPGARVQFTNRGVYENKVGSTGIDPAGMTTSDVTWRKLQDNNIGVDQRLQYNGQIIVFLKAINDWFGVTTAPYIFLVNNNTSGIGFVLHVPVALYNSLGTSNPDRTRRLTEFIDRYITAGYNYSILTF